jgi:argininosuccinate synthase
VNGSVKLRLYKGNIDVLSRKADRSLYSQDWVTFEADGNYNQADATGFINLFGLPIKMNALLKS